MPEAWTKLSYTTNSEVPLVGEIIRLHYPIRTIPFTYGPASAHLASTNGSQTTDKMHHLLIIGVEHDQQSHIIELTFLPIMAYSNPPPNGDRSTWCASDWMSQATDIQRLYHLPVPAVGWTPTPPPDPAAPVISFGSWKNTRCSWIGMVIVPYQIPEEKPWYRHPDGAVILDGGASTIAMLYNFIYIKIPRKLNEIHTAAAAAATTTTTTIAATAAAATAITTATTIAAAADATTTTTTVNSMMLPNHYSVWANVDDRYALSIPSSYISPEDSVSDGEMGRALRGEDGIDPITFWNFPGAPKDLLEIARQQQKTTLDERILNWHDSSVDEGAGESKETSIREDEPNLDVDIGDVGVGEEASGEERVP